MKIFWLFSQITSPPRPPSQCTATPPPPPTMSWPRSPWSPRSTTRWTPWLFTTNQTAMFLPSTSWQELGEISSLRGKKIEAGWCQHYIKLYHPIILNLSGDSLMLSCDSLYILTLRQSMLSRGYFSLKWLQTLSYVMFLEVKLLIMKIIKVLFYLFFRLFINQGSLFQAVL